LKKIYISSVQFLLIGLGLFLMSGISALLSYDHELVINLAKYIQTLTNILHEIFHPSSIFIPWGGAQRTSSIVTVFLETYPYSVIVLFSSFIVAVVFSISISFLFMFLSPKIYRFFYKGLNIIDSFPDIFMVVLFQLFIIWLFMKTNILAFNIYALGEERIYFLPILCLSILPITFLTKHFLYQLKEEATKPYVEFSFSKGFRPSYTIWVHLFRNVWVHFYFHLKPIFLLMLSNLLIIELLFNMNGFMKVLLLTSSASPAAFLLGMLLIYIPFFIVFSLGSLFLSRWLKVSHAL
jgi:ABC-type dipeptide/oligopeptide/nickel transport system permease component